VGVGGVFGDVEFGGAAEDLVESERGGSFG